MDILCAFFFIANNLNHRNLCYGLVSRSDRTRSVEEFREPPPRIWRQKNHEEVVLRNQFSELHVCLTDIIDGMNIPIMASWKPCRPDNMTVM
jgi:hypothetical protein